MPLSFLVIPYFIVVIFFIVLAGAAVYHILRFDLINVVTLSLMFIFFILTILVFGTTAYSLRDVSWGETVSFSPGIPSSSQIDNSFF
jgi:hypothetical protein